MAIIKAENLSLVFKAGYKRQIRALDNLNLEINQGDFFALLGPNGAGKSTAMYCFLGLLRPTSGSVQVFGQQLSLGSEIYDDVAYLPEEPHYHLYLTVEEAVTFYGSLYRTKVSTARVRDVLARLGLDEFRHLRLDRCSKGMRQKVGFAQCMLNQPKLLFLDEPTRGLDPLVIKDIRDNLVELNRQGSTIVMNSHVLSEVETLANRAAIIDRGKLVKNSSITELLEVNRDVYEVEFQCDDDVPDLVTSAVRNERGVKGFIAATELYAFMKYLKSEKATLYKCALLQKTLEQSMHDLLRGKPHD